MSGTQKFPVFRGHHLGTSSCSARIIQRHAKEVEFLQHLPADRGGRKIEMNRCPKHNKFIEGSTEDVPESTQLLLVHQEV